MNPLELPLAGRSSLPRLLAKALILWDERVRRGLRDSAVMELSDRFAAHVYRNFRGESADLSRTNIDLGLQWLCGQHASLIDWYRVLVGGELLKFAPAGQPIVVLDQIDVWENLCARLDADVLLCLACAEVSKPKESPQQQRFLAWPTVARAVDDDLAKLTARKLSDLHIHVSGVRLPQAAWLEMMQNRVELKVFRRLKQIYEDDARNLNAEIDEARHARGYLLSFVGAEPAQLAQPRTDAWWSWSPQLLAQERWMLTSIWQVLLREKQPDDLLRYLDTYLLLKHHFVGLVRQGAFPTEPGLRHFELRYFSALKRARPREDWRRPAPAYGESPRLAMKPYGDACQYLVESKTLQRIELRISPFERTADYLRFFKLWAKLKEQLDRSFEGSRRLDIKFTVHFRRSLARSRRQQEQNQDEPEALIKLRALDRSTSALRMALNSGGERHRAWMSALARIDVAGQERDAPTSLFSLHLRLLRGDKSALRYLEKIDPLDPRRPWLERWISLRNRGQHRPLTKDLGMTIHAGEDFEGLLDGLYQVGVAVNSFNLRRGDGIGHGLALATELDDPRLGTEKFSIMRVGQLFDALCWLMDTLYPKFKNHASATSNAPLQDLIRSTGCLLYRGVMDEAASARAGDHVAVWRRVLMPDEEVWKNDHPRAEARNRLFQRQWDREILSARERPQPGLVTRGLDERVRRVKRILLDQIKNRRIVVELNPSSNARVSGAQTIRDVPAYRLLQMVAARLQVCVNTDNPSVFTTCIENEYALLLKAAADSGKEKDRLDALRWLEQARKTGMSKSHVYWRLA